MLVFRLALYGWERWEEITLVVLFLEEYREIGRKMKEAGYHPYFNP
jgi:hypothetical protein